MKKIIIILMIFLISNCSYAQDKLSFVYINGANNNNIKMKTWYERGVKKLHKLLRKNFIKHPELKKSYKKLGNLDIENEPDIFFWGYNSKADLDYVKRRIKFNITAPFAYFAKKFITENIHDAIWIQKSNNMLPVLDDLNENIKKETEKGNNIILFGYSAGAFIAYEYMFNKLRYINPEVFFEKMSADKDLTDFVKHNKRKDTCLAALLYRNTDIGSMSPYGNFVLNKDTERIKNKYIQLDEITENVCAPENSIAGIVNFANPSPLFYSDLFDDKYELNYFNSLMVKYILENGMFLITVNFREDPIGFSTSGNLTVKDIERHLNMKINKPTGVIYNNSDVWAKRFSFLAHVSYWSAGKTFSKAVVKTLLEGKKFQYNDINNE